MLLGLRVSFGSATFAMQIGFTRTASTITDPKDTYMLFTIAIVLIILWLLGLVSGIAIGQFIHILLIVAIVLILVSLIGGRGK
jgi:hypothetical protein